jgi:hypothetical protein
MKETIIGSLAGLVLLFGAVWGIQGNDFFMYKIFASKYEQVRRDTFEQSKAYRQGMVQELQNMQFEYMKATPDQQVAIASVILHRSADVPSEALTPDLNAFVAMLKNNQREY